MAITYDLEQYLSKLTFEGLDPSMPDLIRRDDVIDSLLDILVENPDVDEFFYVFDGDEWAKTVHNKAKKIAEKTIKRKMRKHNLMWSILVALLVFILI